MLPKMSCFEVCYQFSYCSMSSTKRKRNVLTIETKLEVINQLEKGVSGSSLAVRYNIGKATVSDVKKQKEAILQHAALNLTAKVARKDEKP